MYITIHIFKNWLTKDEKMQRIHKSPLGVK